MYILLGFLSLYFMGFEPAIEFKEREFICHKIQKNIENHSKLTIVAGYQIGKPIKLVALINK